MLRTGVDTVTFCVTIPARDVLESADQVLAALLAPGFMVLVTPRTRARRHPWSAAPVQAARVACRQSGRRRPPTWQAPLLRSGTSSFFAILATFVVAARGNYLRNGRKSCFAAAYSGQQYRNRDG